MTREIDLTKSEQYTLSIRLSTDGFSFSIYNPLNGSDFYFRQFNINTQHSMAANVKEFINETEELKYKYKRINILVATRRYTTVPLDYLEDKEIETTFYQNVSRMNNEIVLCNMLSRSNIAVLFSLDKLTHLYLSELFPEARFYNSISPMAEFFSSRSKQGNCSKLFVNIQTNSIDVLGFNRGYLLILNSYKTSGLDDICYYILNVWQQSQYSQERDELHLCGDTQKRKEISERLQDFIKRIFIINPQSELNNSVTTDIEEVPFEMQSLITCE